MTLLARWDTWLRGRSAPVYLVILLGALVVHTGVGIMPNYTDTARQAMDPFADPFGTEQRDKDYLLGTWFVWFLSWLVGARDVGAVVVFMAVVVLAFLVAGVVVIRTAVAPERRRLAWLLFFLLPAAGVPLYWVGGDGMTLLLMVLAVALVKRPVAAVGPGFLLGMQHVEQGLVAAGGVLLLGVLQAVLDQRRGPVLRFALWWMLGIVSGRAALGLVWAASGMGPESDRLQTAADNVVTFGLQFLGNPAAALWSGLGVVWLVLAFLVQGAWRTYLPVLLASLAMVAAVVLAEDQTRVFAIVSFPLVMIGLVLDERALRDLPGRAVGALAVVGFLVPWIWVWQGELAGSMFPWDVALVLRNLLEHAPAPLASLGELLAAE